MDEPQHLCIMSRVVQIHQEVECKKQQEAIFDVVSFTEVNSVTHHEHFICTGIIIQ